MLYIHAVFHIKSTSVTIRDQDQQALYEYMGGILNRIGCLPVRINGVDDHVHRFASCQEPSPRRR